MIYDGKVLLMLRDDKPTIPWPNTWDWLGGAIEDGENELEALRRELLEEINVEPGKTVYVGHETRVDGSLKHRAVVLMDNSEVTKVHLGDEGQELRWFELDEVLKLDLPDGFRRFMEDNYVYLVELVAGRVSCDPAKFILQR